MEAELPFSASAGYQARMTHRAIKRMLRLAIEPHGIASGRWCVLRVGWAEDGLMRWELSPRISTTEPTPLHAIATMEKIGHVRRVRNPTDQRKLSISLEKDVT
jgi:DNA-binding MarR family transcriptional regulator